MMLKKNKAANKDFAENMLPVDRKEMFFDCVKQRFDVLAKCGLVMLISSALFLFVKIWGDSVFLSLQRNNAENDFAQIASAIQIITALAKVLGYALMGIGIAGISRVIKQIAWGEPVFFFYHMKLGLKQNGLRFFLLFLIFGILNVINVFVLSALDDLILSFLPSAITIFFFIPIGLYMLSQFVYYNVRFWQSFMNGLNLFLKTAPFTWIFVALLYSILLIDFIPSVVVRIIVFTVTVFLIIPVLVLSWLLYSCHVFDKHINQNLYPEIVKKGLYKPKKEQ